MSSAIDSHRFLRLQPCRRSRASSWAWTTTSRAACVNRSNTLLPPPQEPPARVLLVYGLLAHVQLGRDLLPRPAHVPGVLDLDHLELLDQLAKGGHRPEPHPGIPAARLVRDLRGFRHGASIYVDASALSTSVDGNQQDTAAECAPALGSGHGESGLDGVVELRAGDDSRSSVSGNRAQGRPVSPDGRPGPPGPLPQVRLGGRTTGAVVGDV